MIVFGIILIVSGILLRRFLNRPEPYTPAIAVYVLAHIVPTISILIGIILLIIGIIKS